jgi:phytoene dehydrogenase-like protein
MSAGVHTAKSGFETIIYESHTIPGGNCTSWKRKGYLFEGGMHWVTGSSKDQMLYKVWEDVGALSDTTKIINTDPFMVCMWKGEEICLYRDVDRLENHLIKVSFEDTALIRQLCKDIRRFRSLKMPIMNIQGLKVKKGAVPTTSLRDLMAMIPALLRLPALSKISARDYAARFKHQGIRLLLSEVVNPEYDCVSLFFSLGEFLSGDGGYVGGGSLMVANGMAKRFRELGGEIRFGKRVEQVIVENGKAVGVMVNGERIEADAVIVTGDTLAAIDTLFTPSFNEKWAMNMKRDTIPLISTFAGFGVEADLSALPENILFPLEKPFKFAGQVFSAFGFYNYGAYKNYAPKGCSVLTTLLVGDTYNYWKAAQDRGCYEEHKAELAAAVFRYAEENIPQVRGKLLHWNIATPLTYERFCGTYRGSWMTITPPGVKRVTYPHKSAKIKSLYFAGQRIMSPGGLPVAVATGRNAAQYLCRDFGAVFG